MGCAGGAEGAEDGMSFGGAEDGIWDMGLRIKDGMSLGGAEDGI
jgi:hypothetical protein